MRSATWSGRSRLCAIGPPSTSKAVVLSRYAAALQLANEPARALELVREGRDIAEEVDDAEMRAESHVTLGLLRLNAGDRGGLSEIERALELALESNSLQAAERCYANLADAHAAHMCALERCFDLQAEGRRLAERIGWPRWRHFFAGELVRSSTIAAPGTKPLASPSRSSRRYRGARARISSRYRRVPQ